MIFEVEGLIIEKYIEKIPSILNINDYREIERHLLYGYINKLFAEITLYKKFHNIGIEVDYSIRFIDISEINFIKYTHTIKDKKNIEIYPSRHDIIEIKNDIFEMYKYGIKRNIHDKKYPDGSYKVNMELFNGPPIESIKRNVYILYTLSENNEFLNNFIKYSILKPSFKTSLTTETKTGQILHNKIYNTFVSNPLSETIIPENIIILSNSFKISDITSKLIGSYNVITVNFYHLNIKCNKDENEKDFTNLSNEIHLKVLKESDNLRNDNNTLINNNILKNPIITDNYSERNLELMIPPDDKWIEIPKKKKEKRKFQKINN